MLAFWRARVDSPYGSLYSATKAAVNALTQSLAKELGPRVVEGTTGIAKTRRLGAARELALAGSVHV